MEQPWAQQALASAADAWLAQPLLLWGVGPVVASALGFLVPALLLELVLASGAMDTWLMTYKSSGYKPRKQLLAATHGRIPFRKQLVGSLKFVLGPPALAAALGLAGLQVVTGRAAADGWLPSSVALGLLQFVGMVVINDLGLYLGHRVQHESAWLWEHVHSKHHSIDTPTATSTLFIHPLDATLQGSLPIVLAALAFNPAPLLLYAFVAFRVAENTLNHSGLADCWLLDVLSLKCLPLRAPVSFHDSHHKYCNHGGGASNFAESFIVWDWLLGTLAPASLAGVSAAKVAAAAAKKA